MTNTTPEKRVDKNGNLVTRHVSGDTSKHGNLRQLLNLPPRGFSAHKSSERLFSLPESEQRDEVLTILHENGSTEFEEYRPSTPDSEIASAILAARGSIVNGSSTPVETEQVLRWAQGVVAMSALKGIREEIGATRSAGRVSLVSEDVDLAQIGR